MELVFTVEGNPASKKNSMQIIFLPSAKGYVFIKDKKTGKLRPVIPSLAQNKTYKTYEKEFAKYAPKLDEPISVPCEVTALYYRKDNRRCDRTNLESALLDCLVKYKVISDDNWRVVFSTDGSRVYVDPSHPRTEVTIKY